MDRLKKAYSSLILLLFLTASAFSCYSYAKNFHKDIGKSAVPQTITTGEELPLIFLESSDDNVQCLESIREMETIFCPKNLSGKKYFSESAGIFITIKSCLIHSRSKYLHSIISITTLF